MERNINISIDRGGTFTDVFASHPGGTLSLKLLSQDPSYPDAPREGIRRVLEIVTGLPHPRENKVDTSRLASIRMGTTVATNALLERKGERCALVITKGFANLLHIGTQARPDIFDLTVKCPDVLYENVIEAEERVLLHREDTQDDVGNIGLREVTGVTGEKVLVKTPLNESLLKSDLEKLFAEGYRSVAIVFVHSYTFRDHEIAAGRVASEIGFTQVSLSSHLVGMVKVVPRGITACVDAYLTPSVKRYLLQFSAGFDENFSDVDVLFMQSDGGLVPTHSFNGYRAILSGPAGGVVGYASTTFDETTRQPVIGFDMGGTSTDVSRFGGTYEHVFETITAGTVIQAPQLDINTVAAGGGSRLFYRNKMFVVGPESSSAIPGPVCYRRSGGLLSITDANLVLGRIQSDFFPKIFGPKENEALDFDGALAAMAKITAEINADRPAETLYTVDEVAIGFIRVANEAMCRPIRSLTSARGYDTRKHVLACFGGAGGQHACAIARSLGMSKIFVHRQSGILSAYGLALAHVVEDVQEPCACELNESTFQSVLDRMARCAETASHRLSEHGRSVREYEVQPFINIRYKGLDSAIMTPGTISTLPSDAASADFQTAVRTTDLKSYLASLSAQFQREFGFEPQAQSVPICDDVRVRVVAKSHTRTVSKSSDHASTNSAAAELTPVAIRPVYFDSGRLATKFYRIDDLLSSSNCVVEGPAVILDANSTTLIEPDCSATVSPDGDISISVSSAVTAAANISEAVDPVGVSVFGHRFMSIAEQMGRTLQRTAISTNIKERLDYSCAIFDAQGGLVANAPHIPVHLGSMQEAIRYQIEHRKGDIFPGDVLVSNHPIAGGTHLPDITVITPVFEGDTPIFYVASRGHHADIGGITAGSMPPHSTHISQEGAAIVSHKLVSRGKFDREAISDILRSPALVPGSSGARRLDDNISDLLAQIAANHKGIQLVEDLVSEYSLPVVQAYMSHIQHTAEIAVRNLLRSISASGTLQLHNTDKMDDGSPICLKISINPDDASATFDFTGTGPQVIGNCNAPRAVCHAAIIYALRCLIADDIPLNQGCLVPINIIIPRGSILYPDNEAAVVGGNVLTSQRVCDVIFKAFGACADSQGCMNNLTFGDATFGHYETIAGGSGAGKGWHGRSGVHTHMTNTRITDIEIMERRFPVVVEKFGLRTGSGGRGEFNGGEGVIRRLYFRKTLQVSVLSERRAIAPHGISGGLDALPGMNILHRKDRGPINVGGKIAVQVQPGDVLEVNTPGGGGFGTPS